MRSVHPERDLVSLATSLSATLDDAMTTETNGICPDGRDRYLIHRCMAYYHPLHPAFISVDSSCFDLGAVLLQDQPTGEHQTMAWASCSLTQTSSGTARLSRKRAIGGCLGFDECIQGLVVLSHLGSVRHLAACTRALRQGRRAERNLIGFYRHVGKRERVHNLSTLACF